MQINVVIHGEPFHSKPHPKDSPPIQLSSAAEVHKNDISCIQLNEWCKTRLFVNLGSIAHNVQLDSCSAQLGDARCSIGPLCAVDWVAVRVDWMVGVWVLDSLCAV